MSSSKYGHSNQSRSAIPSRQLTLNFAPILIQDLTVEAVQPDQTSKVIEHFVNNIDEIARLHSFPDWQETCAGKRKVKRALRKTLFKHQLHQDTKLFEKAYSYIRQYC